MDNRTSRYEKKDFLPAPRPNPKFGWKFVKILDFLDGRHPRWLSGVLYHLGFLWRCVAGAMSGKRRLVALRVTKKNRNSYTITVPCTTPLSDTSYAHTRTNPIVQVQTVNGKITVAHLRHRMGRISQKLKAKVIY